MGAFDKIRCQCSTGEDGTNRIKKLIQQDRHLLIAIVVLVVLMNVPFGRFLLYPFLLFSTWVHEMCHGIAALLVGGRIHSLMVYPNGSGLAYTSLSGDGNYDMKRAFIASAGYTGTSIVGGILLLFRRTGRGPRIGLIAIGAILVLSCAIFVRNWFGLITLIPMGLALIICGWKLQPGHGVGTIYAFVAATCCLNAITSIHYLFDTSDSLVGGEERKSDAQTVADHIGMTYWFWAGLWFLLAIVMLAVGLVFALPPSESVSRDNSSGASNSGEADSEAPQSNEDQAAILY